MTKLMLLSWKNLTRYKKRTIITSIALSVGLAIFILIDSMLVGIDRDSEINLVRYETASIRIMNEGYWEKHQNLPLNKNVEDAVSVLALLEEEGLTAVPRISFGGDMVMYQDPFPEDGSVPVQIEGIDPLRDDLVFAFKDTLIKGRFITPGKNEVVLGSWLAEDVGADIGYPIKILTRTKDGYQQSFSMTVVGIVNCPNPNVNRRTLLMPIDVADDYLEMDGAVTGINLRYPDFVDTEALAISLEESLNLPAGLSVVPWQTMAQDYLQLAMAKRSGTSSILFLVFLIAAVGITNTMLMSIFERTRELGMMRALGMDNAHIRRMFLYESAGIGLLGGIIGIGLGALMVFPLVKWGIDFTWMFRKMDMGYRISGVMYGVWRPQTMIAALFSGILACVIIAWFPAKKAINMKITNCLNHQ